MSSDYYQVCDDCKLLAHHHSGRYVDDTAHEFMEDHASSCKPGSVRVFYDVPELDDYDKYDNYDDILENLANDIGVDEKLLSVHMFWNAETEKKWWSAGFKYTNLHKLAYLYGYGPTIHDAVKDFTKQFKNGKKSNA